MGAVVVCRIISANWNEFIRPRLLLNTLPCHEKFLQDVFITAVRVLVDNVVLKFIVDVRQDKGKLRQALLCRVRLKIF